MRAKKIFRDSANLWFVGLLTVQFCAGLVYALDAERVRNSGEEIKVKADSLWAFYHDNSAVQINMPAANSPYSEGACPEADAVFKSQSEYVPYWKRAECPVELRKCGDGFWRAAAYGKNANAPPLHARRAGTAVGARRWCALFGDAEPSSRRGHH